MSARRCRKTAEEGAGPDAAQLLPALRVERDRLLLGARRLQGHIQELEGAKVEGVENAFGRNVQTYRKLAGLSQSDLAERLGISRSRVTQIELGRHTTIEHLLSLCEIFAVTPNDLLLSSGPVAQLTR